MCAIVNGFGGYHRNMTWRYDAAVQTKLCPDGYKLLDQGRDGRRGGGTSLIFSDSLVEKKVDAGAKVSFEFSEWTVQSVSHDFGWLFYTDRKPILTYTKFLLVHFQGIQ